MKLHALFTSDSWYYTSVVYNVAMRETGKEYMGSLYYLETSYRYVIISKYEVKNKHGFSSQTVCIQTPLLSPINCVLADALLNLFSLLYRVPVNFQRSSVWHTFYTGISKKTSES